MPTDRQNVDFLYTIIKQLEVKHINWPTIADQNSIPNGHAARMRFHRLRQAQEGMTPRPRAAKGSKGSDSAGPRGARKAKSAAESRLKRKLAELIEDSEDDEVPLAYRRKVKVEDNASGVEYVEDGDRVKKEESPVKMEDDGEEPGIKTEVPADAEDSKDGLVVSVKAEPDEVMDDSSLLLGTEIREDDVCSDDRIETTKGVRENLYLSPTGL